MEVVKVMEEVEEVEEVEELSVQQKGVALQQTGH